jgi:putative FmdB family regulatory protein
MPLYEYYCRECGTQFEKMVRFTQVAEGAPAAQTPECPRCGSDQTNKQISTFASLLGGQSSGSGAAASSCSSGSSRFR